MLIYKPARQFMTPNNVPIDPAIDNSFELEVSGQVCNAYRFSIFDMKNNKIDAVSTDRVNLDTPLYDGDVLKHTVPAGSLTPGNTYKWQSDIYANDTLFSNDVKKSFTVTVVASTDLFTTTNDFKHELSDGDMVTIASTTTLPAPLKADTSYYIKKKEDSETSFYLCETKNSAKADDGKHIDITSAGSGTHTITYIGTEFSCAGNHNINTGDMVFVSANKPYPVAVDLEVVKNLYIYFASEKTSDFSTVTLHKFAAENTESVEASTLNYKFTLSQGSETIQAIDYVYSHEMEPITFSGGNEDGQIPQLVFDSVGVHQFSISESEGASGANENLTYDTNKIDVTITVTKSEDDLSLLVANVEYKKGTKVLSEGENEFVNVLYEYRDDPTGSVNSLSEATEVDDSDYAPQTEFVSVVEGELSSDELPEPLKEYTPYYVRKVDGKTIALFEHPEGAKNDAGRIEFTKMIAGNFVVNNIAISEQVAFDVYEIPEFKLVPGTITSQAHLFVPQYTHPQNVMINNWVAYICTADPDRELTDDMLEDGTCDSSGIIYRSKVEHKFDGLLNGVEYFVRFVAETNVGQKIDTGFTRYGVSYDAAKLDIEPTATNDEFNSCIRVNWGGLVSIPGIFEGGDPEFVDDFVYEGNEALKIKDGQKLRYENLSMNENAMPPRFWWSPNTDDFSGTIMTARNTGSGESLVVKYEAGAFYIVVNGIEKLSKIMEINSKYAYLLGFVDGDLKVLTIGLKGWI